MSCAQTCSTCRLGRQHAVAKKSILFLTNVLGFGGAEIQVHRLAIGLARRGWGVTVTTLLPPKNLVQPLLDSGVSIECLGMRRGVPNPLALYRLRQVVNAHSPQIVHSHVVHANLLARATRLFARMPVLVTSAHSMIECGRSLEIAYRLTDRLGDLTTNVSQAAVDRYVQRGITPANRITFVPNGVDTLRFRPDAAQRQRWREELQLNGHFVWLAVGRLAPEKNLANMLDAFARIGGTDSILLLAGRGPMDAELRQRATDLGLNGRVRFLGARSDVPALMNCADAYVLSSDWEGMPLVLQESSASGLPAVATDVGGNREVILDGQTGLLVPPRDSAALADATRRVMAMSPDQRREWGLKGREHIASKFDLEKVLDRWESIYDACLRKNSNGPVCEVVL